MSPVSTPKKEEDVLKTADIAASMDLSEDAKQAMEVLDEPMNSVYYMYDADFCDIAELHEAGGEEELVDSVYFLPCDPAYNLSRQNEWENTTHDVFGPNFMEYF